MKRRTLLRDKTVKLKDGTDEIEDEGEDGKFSEKNGGKIIDALSGENKDGVRSSLVKDKSLKNKEKNVVKFEGSGGDFVEIVGENKSLYKKNGENDAGDNDESSGDEKSGKKGSKKRNEMRKVSYAKLSVKKSKFKQREELFPIV